MSESSGMDIVGSVGVRVVPIIDPQDVAQAVERAAQGATAARATSSAARASVAASAAASAPIPHLQTPTPALTPQGVESLYTRTAIERRLYNEMRPEIDQIQGLYEQRLEPYAAPYTFASNKLPGEITRQLQGHPARKQIRSLFTTGVAGGSGADALSDLGEDAYFRTAEYLAGSPGGHALDAARRYGSPHQQLLAAIAGGLARRGTPLAPMEHINAAALQTGSRFNIGGYAYSVIEPDEGQRMLRGATLRHDLPLESLGMIPADVGSLRLPAPAAVPDFLADVGASPNAPGRRIPLNVLSNEAMAFARGMGRGPRALPAPGMASSEFASFTNPYGVGEVNYIGPRPEAPERPVWARGGRRRAAFDPMSLVEQIQELEGVLPNANRQSREILEAAIGGYKHRLKAAGYDYDELKAGRPALITPPPGSVGGGVPPIDPPKSGRVAAGGDEEPRRRPTGSGGGSRAMILRPTPTYQRPQAPDEEVFDAEVVDPSTYADPFYMGGHATRGTYTGRKPRRRRAARSRPRRGLGGIAEAFADFLNDESGRAGGNTRSSTQGSLLGSFGRHIGAMFAAPFMSRMRPANQYRAMRLARSIRTFSNRRLMGFGNYMNAFWGGGELLGSLSATMNSNAEAALQVDPAQQAQTYLSGYQQASAGFFSRFASFAIDPFGREQTGIITTLGRAQAQDAASAARRNLASLNRRSVDPITAAGRSLRGVTDSITERSDAVSAELSTIRAEMLTEGQAAEERVMSTYSSFVAQARSAVLGTNDAEQLAREAMDARFAVQRPREEQFRRLVAEQRQADREAVTSFANEFVRSNVMAAEDMSRAARFAGNPVGLARAQLNVDQERERTDFANPKYRQEFIKAAVASGMTEGQAANAFGVLKGSLDYRQQQQRDLFEAVTADNQRRYLASVDDQLSIMAGQRTGGTVGAMRASRTAAIRQFGQDLTDQGVTGFAWMSRVARFGFETSYRTEQDIAYERGSRLSASEAGARAQSLMNQSRPFDAQREIVRSQYDQRRATEMRADPEFFNSSMRKALDAEEAAALAGIAKNELGSLSQIGLSLDTQENVLRATIGAATGRRGMYAPRAASIIGGLREQIQQATMSGNSWSVGRLRQNALLQVEADQASFFSGFRVMQRQSINEIDTSGRGFAEAIGEFSSARAQIGSSGSSGRSIGDLFSTINQSLFYRYLQASLPSLEE